MQACMYLCMYLCMYSLYEGVCVYRMTNKRKHKTKQTPETNRRTQTQETDHKTFVVWDRGRKPITNSAPEDDLPLYHIPCT